MTYRHRLFPTAVALILGTFACAFTGCAPSNTDHPTEPMAHEIAVTDQWAIAADAGMSSVFGLLTNAGRRDARIVSGSSPSAGRVEIHEVVGDAVEGKTMRPKEGGLVIPAGGSHELAPGGDHVMLMDLEHPLAPGTDVPVTLVFEDGSTLPVTAQVRDFAGGDEEYHHG